MLVDLGRQLRDAAIRAEINRGMVQLLGDFAEARRGRRRLHRRAGERLDIEVLIGRIELTVGRDLQYPPMVP